MHLAAARLYEGRFVLVRALLKDPARTLHRLSTEPSTFGIVREGLTGERRREAVQNLITAAKAYIVARRKKTTHAVHQADLGIPLSRSPSRRR